MQRQHVVYVVLRVKRELAARTNPSEATAGVDCQLGRRVLWRWRGELLSMAAHCVCHELRWVESVQHEVSLRAPLLHLLS